MKLLRRNNKKYKPSAESGRSVVFIDRTKKSAGFLVAQRKRSPRFLKKLIAVRGKLKNLFFILLVIITSGGIVTLFILVNSKSDFYVSPVPSGFASTQEINGVEKVIERALKKNDIVSKKILYSAPSEYKVILDDNSEVLISGDKGITEQIATLQFIRNRLTMEGRKFRKLDLRFDKPVILF